MSRSPTWWSSLMKRLSTHNRRGRASSPQVLIFVAGVAGLAGIKTLVAKFFTVIDVRLPSLDKRVRAAAPRLSRSRPFKAMEPARCHE